MINPIKCFLAVSVFFTMTVSAFSQYEFYKPLDGFGIEISLSNSTLKRMPMYRNSIASLAVNGDNIIGGTAADEGLSPFVFVASLGKRQLVALKDVSQVVKGQRSIQSGFFKGTDQTMYAGTLANKLSNGSNGSGHLIQVRATAADIQVIDLGIPVNGESVYALTGNTAGSKLYGMTYPSGIFFSYDIAGKTFKTYDSTKTTTEEAKVLKSEFHQKPEDYLCSALVVDDHGIVYGSQSINQLFAFDPTSERFTKLAELPEVWGRRTLGRAEAWAKSKTGMLYGGNAGDGQLFELNPQTKKIKNLGKPILMNHLRGLCFGGDGKLYGLAGAPPGYSHLFSYDAAGEGYKDMGNPQFILKAPGIEQGIEWRGFQLRTITASEDGKFIVMGEDEALSELLVFPVGD